MSRPRILILEDDAEWMDLVQHVLERAGYEVQSASTVDEALDLLHARTFHTAIVDMSLELSNARDEGGFLFIDELRSRAILKDMSIIILSAYGTTERVRKAFRDYNVYDWIEKQRLDLEEFLNTVVDAIADAYSG